MRKYLFSQFGFLLIGLLISTNSIVAQLKGQALIDSLSNELIKYKPKCNEACLSDSSKVIILNALAWQLQSQNPDTSIIIYNSALNIAGKINWKFGEAQIRNNLGPIYEKRGNYKEALRYLREAIRIWEDLLPQEKSRRILSSLAFAQGNLANIFLKRGDYSSSLEYFLKIISIFEKLGLNNYVTLTIGNIAIVYIRMNDFNKAIEYSKKALKLEEDSKNEYGISRNCTNLGISFKELKQYDDALHYHFRALEILKRLNNNFESSKCLSNISNIYQAMNEFDKALGYSFQALKIDTEFNNNEGIAMRQMNIGSIYLDMKKFNEAEIYIKKSLVVAENIGYHELIRECYKNLRVLYEQKGDYSEALKYYKKERVIEDSTFNEVKTKEITRLEMNYEFEKKEALTKAEYEKQTAIAEYEKQTAIAEADKKWAIAEADKKLQVSEADKKRLEAETEKQMITQLMTQKELNAEFERKEAQQKIKLADTQAQLQKQKTFRYSIAGVAAILLLASVFGFLVYKKNAEQKQKETSLNLQVSETEMKALRSQMNPHFIFNALQSIQFFLLSHKSEEANLYLLKFSKLMRAVLENSQHSEVPLKDDMQALELYMQLESIRLAHPFTYQFHIDESVDVENTTIPPLILQPFVENAIWHGLQYKQGPGHININISKKENALYATVEDNGVGRDMSKQVVQPMLLKKESLGMKLTEERLKILNELKKIKAQFKITDLFTKDNQPAGTKVELSLPLVA